MNGFKYILKNQFVNNYELFKIIIIKAYWIFGQKGSDHLENDISCNLYKTFYVVKVKSERNCNQIEIRQMNFTKK